MKNNPTPKRSRQAKVDALRPQLIRNGNNEYLHLIIRINDYVSASMPFDWALVLCRKLRLTAKEFRKLVQQTGRQLIAAGQVVKGKFSASIRAAINAQYPQVAK